MTTEREDLRAWLLAMVADAYHGKQPPHPFEECGDPFCSDAYRMAVAIADVVDAARLIAAETTMPPAYDAIGVTARNIARSALRRLDGSS